MSFKAITPLMLHVNDLALLFQFVGPLFLEMPILSYYCIARNILLSHFTQIEDDDGLIGPLIAGSDSDLVTLVSEVFFQMFNLSLSSAHNKPPLLVSSVAPPHLNTRQPIFKQQDVLRNSPLIFKNTGLLECNPIVFIMF